MGESLRLEVQDAEPRRRRKGPVPFSVPDCLRRADETMAGPCRGYLQRVPGRGELVIRFVLPLELCKTANALISMVGGRGRGGGKMSGAAKAATYKERVFRMLWLQHPNVRVAPLTGRVFIRAVRFSTKECDQESNGLKTAIDLLRVPRPARPDGKGGKKGLGFLIDDAPRFVEIASWWEYAPPGRGFGLLELFGEAP